MNERIKELSNEAGLVADATYAKAPDATWLREYNKKFAELIVKEILPMIPPECDKVILEHFGVEE